MILSLGMIKVESPELFTIKDEDGIQHQVVGPPQGRAELVASIEDYFADPYLWSNGQYNNPALVRARHLADDLFPVLEQYPDIPLTRDVFGLIEQAIPPSDIPDKPIVEWFSRDEQGKKDLVRNRAMERCAVTGKPSREVHETFTRGAYGEAALVPWNMEVFSPAIHDRIQQHQMEILRADPLDTRKMNKKDRCGIFIIIDLDGHPAKQKDLWIYHRADWRVSEQDIIDVQREILAVRRARWDIGKKLSRLKRCDGYQAGGYGDIYELAASYGMASPQVKLLIRSADFAAESESELLEAVDVEVADQLKGLPEEDLVEVFTLFANSTPAGAWEQYHAQHEPKKNKRKFRVMKRQPYEEIRADSIDDEKVQKARKRFGPNEMVETGGSVIVGITEDVDG